MPIRDRNPVAALHDAVARQDELRPVVSLDVNAGVLALGIGHNRFGRRRREQRLDAVSA